MIFRVIAQAARLPGAGERLMSIKAPLLAARLIRWRAAAQKNADTRVPRAE
jgi:hypothetical protein